MYMCLVCSWHVVSYGRVGIIVTMSRIRLQLYYGLKLFNFIWICTLATCVVSCSSNEGHMSVYSTSMGCMLPTSIEKAKS